MNHNYDLPKRNLVSQQDSALIARPDVPRSTFRGSWTRKTTFDAGRLYPFMVDEVLPGDQLSYDVTAYVRMATPLFPMFDNQRIDTFFFFVPCRLVWSNWVRFMGEQNNPSDSIDYTIPIITSDPDGFVQNSLADHFGLPTVLSSGQDIEVNALPFRAYNLIWNEWFRDQNLQNSVPTNVTSDGPDGWSDYAFPLQRAKSADYFTSCLPWPQKFTAPNIPLSGQIPVSGIGFVNGTSLPAGGVLVADAAIPGIITYDPTTAGSNPNVVYFRSTSAGNRPEIFAELDYATVGITIDQLRTAFQVQQLLEKDARGGTRYIELIKNHFGVNSPDARLQRPEYIGGGSTPLVLTPVAQTAPTSGVPLGALGAAGTAVGKHRASYASTEHGYIIALINVKSELSYGQGAHRMWRRQTRYDFYWPSLSGLSEQAVFRGELFYDGDSDLDELVFGYQERWQEYRTRYSEVTGAFRSQATGTLDAWHLAQAFSFPVLPPVLGPTFIADSPPMARVLAAGDTAAGQNYLADILISRTAVRPIPTYGTPVSLGRF